MTWLKRIGFFLLTNLLIMIMVSVVWSIVSTFFMPKLTGEVAYLAVFSGVFGMCGAFTSLLMSRWMAKMFHGVQVIDPSTSDPDAVWLVKTVHGLAGKAAPITVGKLVGHPLAVLAAAWLAVRLGMPAMAPQLLTGAVLAAAMPMLGVYTILAQRYGQEEQSAAALLLTTVASFFTLSGLLWGLKMTGALG